MNKEKYLELYDKLYDELCEISEEILPFYDVDKVKSYSVYIWTKGKDNVNVFDIHAEKIVFYDKEHEIIEEAKIIIEKIQEKLREIKYLENNKEAYMREIKN